METPNYRKGSIIFDDDTILQVEQRGGGGSGVGGETGLAAVNLKTGESTNAALAAKDETIAEQAATIETQAGTIEEQAATIETQAATIIEKDETIATQAATITEQAGTIEGLERQLNRAPEFETKTVNIVPNVPCSIIDRTGLTSQGYIIRLIRVTQTGESSRLFVKGGGDIVRWSLPLIPEGDPSTYQVVLNNWPTGSIFTGNGINLPQNYDIRQFPTSPRPEVVINTRP